MGIHRRIWTNGGRASLSICRRVFTKDWRESIFGPRCPVRREISPVTTLPCMRFICLKTIDPIFRDVFRKVASLDISTRPAKLVIAPQFFVAHDFSEGLAAVRVEETADSKFGYIDRSGNMAIAPRFHQAGPFSEGLAAVETSARVVGNQVVDIAWGFIDKAGVLKIPDKYQFAGNFSEGLARVAIKLGVSVGYIDRDGKMIIPPTFFKLGISQMVSPQFAPTNVCYIDRSGAAVLKDFHASWPFSDGLAVIGFLCPASLH